MDHQKPVVLDSRVTSVTVYGDRAQVTRSAALELAAGEHILQFPNLPQDVEPNSVQVNGKGSAVIQDVKFRSEHHEEPNLDALKRLADEKTKIEDKLSAVEDGISQCRKEKELVESIAKKLVRPTREMSGDEFDPEKWEKMSAFYRQKSESLDAQVRDKNLEKRALSKSLEKIQRDIQELGSGQYLENRLIDISVSLKDRGKITLNATYLVYGPSWRPVYDLRVSAEDKKMSLGYNAVIRQGTGEDWIDVSLKLSTAQAQVSGVQPELTPWHLYVQQPYAANRSAPMAKASIASGAGAPMEKKKDRQMFAADEASIMEQAPEPMEEEVLEAPETSVETGTTAVVFAVGGSSSIASDNQDHKATILLEEFPAVFRYSAAPKLSPYAYLKAKVKNTTEYPLLAGESNIFLDNNFVSTAAIELVAPGEEFWTFLGIDESVKVEHKILKKFHKEGLIGKKDTLVYEFLIKITNNKKTEEEIVVWDQIPISNDQNIAVKLIEPAFKENSESLKMNEEKFLEWYRKMKPGEKLEIPLKFSVEYPRGAWIPGL